MADDLFDLLYWLLADVPSDVVVLLVVAPLLFALLAYWYQRRKRRGDER